MELKETKLKEEIKVIDGKVYAVVAALGKKRQLNGCEARKFNNETIKSLEFIKAGLQADLERINSDLIKAKKLDSELASCGYCKLDEVEYKKIDGIVMKDAEGQPIVIGKTHNELCSHKGE